MPQASNQNTILIVGGGPAGLRAAEVAAESGAKVILLEAKRYVGRKFLVAGKSGLNLTNAETLPTFPSKYTGPDQRWNQLINDFDNQDIRTWAEQLGFTTFESGGGKVFPEPMKAAPLLRAWVQKLKNLGVYLRFNCRLVQIDGDYLTLSTGEIFQFDAAVLAFGGASWKSTGSDGTWRSILEKHGVKVIPFSPANCGWEIDWPEEIRLECEGLPLKNVMLSSGPSSRKGELTVTHYGLEGGPIYHLGPFLRAQDNPEIYLDFKPDLSQQEVERRLAPVKKNFIREATRRLNLSAPAAALLKYLPHLGPWKDPIVLARAVKQCQIPLIGPRPIDEAISTAGGVCWDELTPNLMLKRLPGVFVAGEMIDWEAPTGGYLLQGCFATGHAAGKAALKYGSDRG